MGAYKKNLILSLGLISASVDLEAVAPRVSSGLNRVCPEHTVKLKQQYLCPGTDEAESHTVAWGAWSMGRETGEGYKIVDVAERPRIEGATGFSLVPVPRKDLESSTFEGDAIYYAAPSSEHVEESWAILNKIVTQGKVALITKGALRAGTTTEKIWRLSSFNGFLVLREVRFPENIKTKPAMPKVKPDKATMDLVGQFIEKLTVEWDAFDSSDTMSARMAEWMETGTDTESQAAAAPAPLDIKAALAAALEEG
jgi:hypothetical protein